MSNSVSGDFLTQFAGLLNLFIKNNATEDQFNQLIDPELLSKLLSCDPSKVNHKKLCDVLGINFKITPTVQTVCGIINVLPNLDFSERFLAGNYDWVNPDLTEISLLHNPLMAGEWESELFGFQMVSSEDVKTILEVDGWICATWEHECAFGVAFPEAQHKNAIVALGSLCNVPGGNCVPVLTRGGPGRRFMDIRYLEGDWCPGYRFLRVRRIAT